MGLSMGATDRGHRTMRHQRELEANTLEAGHLQLESSMGLQGVGSSLYLVPATIAVQLVRRTVLTLATRLRASEKKLEEHQRMSMETMSEVGSNRQKFLEMGEENVKLQEQLRFLDQRVEELTKEAMSMVPAERVEQMRQSMELQEVEDRRSKERMTELMTTAATSGSKAEQMEERVRVHEEQNLQLQRALVTARKHAEKREADLARAKSFLHRKEAEMTEMQRVMVDHASQQHELSQLKERVSDKETKEMLLQSEIRATANAALNAEERCVKMEGMLKQLHGENEKQVGATMQLTLQGEEKNLALLETQEQLRTAQSTARK